MKAGWIKYESGMDEFIILPIPPSQSLLNPELEIL